MGKRRLDWVGDVDVARIADSAHVDQHDGTGAETGLQAPGVELLEAWHSAAPGQGRAQSRARTDGRDAPSAARQSPRQRPQLRAVGPAGSCGYERVPAGHRTVLHLWARLAGRGPAASEPTGEEWF